MENNKIKITFERSAAQIVLDLFGKSIDSERCLVEKDNPAQRVLTPEGEEIRLREFAGLRKGSEIFIKKDLSSLIEAADHIK